MEIIQSASVLQVLAKLAAQKPTAPRPQAQWVAADQEQAPRTDALAVLQDVAPATAPAPSGAGVDRGVPVTPAETTPAQDPLEVLAEQASPNYQKALLEATAQRNRLQADIARLRAQMHQQQASGNAQADDLLGDMARLEQALERHIRQLVQSDALNRLGAEAPGVDTSTAQLASLSAYVKNSQAVYLMGVPRQSVADVADDAEASPVAAQAQTPAVTLGRLMQGELPPASPAHAADGQDLLGELLLAGPLAA